MADAIIKAVQATKNFGGLVAVDHLDLTLTQGSIHSLIGPNGSGKTTFLNLLSRIYDLSEGQILFKTTAVNRLAPHRVAELGVARTFQNIRLFGDLSILDNVMVGCHCRGKSALRDILFRTRRLRDEEREFRRRALEMLEFVGLDVPSDRVATQLSYGQQRLVEIARALASSPSVLLLDEPAAGMNPVEKAELVNLIRKIRDKLGITVLLVEHNMNVVMTISEKVTVINFGRKIAEGTPQEVQESEEVIEAYLGRRLEEDA
ncbi:MAG: ABC transporter ATP-binding protein [Bacillota bacterium]|nr:ABC transporter ATP-binding protein [Bacillota bacterium]